MLIKLMSKFSQCENLKLMEQSKPKRGQDQIFFSRTFLATSIASINVNYMHKSKE